MKQKEYRRKDFKKCPNCGGMLLHDEDQTECIHCLLVLTDECCYTIKGGKVDVKSKQKKRRNF